MYLSDVDLREAVKCGDLIVNPLPDKEIGPTSIDLHLRPVEEAKVWDFETLAAHNKDLGLKSRELNVARMPILTASTYMWTMRAVLSIAGQPVSFVGFRHVCDDCMDYQSRKIAPKSKEVGSVKWLLLQDITTLQLPRVNFHITNILENPGAGSGSNFQNIITSFLSLKVVKKKTIVIIRTYGYRLRATLTQIFRLCSGPLWRVREGWFDLRTLGLGGRIFVLCGWPENLREQRWVEGGLAL